MSFVDEINRIRENNKPTPFVINSKETLAVFKEKSQVFIDEICNQIRSSIKSAAQAGHIEGDKNRRSVFQRDKLLNSHYSAHFNSLVRINTVASMFTYEMLDCCQPYGERETRKGFVINDAKTIEFVLAQIEQQLAKDKIYYVVQQNTSQYYATRGYMKTQRKKLPIDEIVNNINTMLAKRKKDSTAYMYDIFINWTFAYFI